MAGFTVGSCPGTRDAERHREVSPGADLGCNCRMKTQLVDLIQKSTRWDMEWVTRKNVKVDRVACPWLIKKFVDPDAKFLFVAEEELLDEARRGAIPFRPPKLSEVK